jgi:hypothetical protein
MSRRRPLIAVLSRGRDEGTDTLVQLLRRDHDVIERTCPIELLAAVPRARIAALLCDADIFLEESAGLRELIERLPCAALLGRHDAEEIGRARALGCGLEVVMLDRPLGAFVARLRRRLAPRTSERVSLDGFQARFELQGRELVFPLADISNQGFAFKAPARLAGGRLLPGTPLARPRLTRNEIALLEGVPAVVRSVQVEGSEPGQGLVYRIGCELVPAGSSTVGSELKVVDPLGVRTLLEEAVALELLHVRVLDDGLAPVRPQLARVQEPDRLFVRAALPVELDTGDLVEVRFELQGASYSFAAGVVALARSAGATEFSLKIPRTLAGFRRRRAARLRPGVGNAPVAYLRSPFASSWQRFPVINLTSRGLAVRIGHEHLFPVGTRVPRVRLRFADGQVLTCPARVRSLFPEGGGLRCGLELEWDPSDHKTRVAHAIATAGRRDVVTMTGVEPPAIWQLLERSGFLYAEKKAAVDQLAAQQTLARLAADESDVFKGAVVIRDGSPHGHIAAIRAYSKTWIVHHLSALPGGRQDSSLARILVLSILEYLEQRPDAEWIRAFYRPENRWPARVFGSVARLMSDSRLSTYQVLRYLRPDGQSAAPVAAPGLRVRPAEPGDLEAAEAMFVGRANHIGLSAEDLCASELRLDTVAQCYRPLGLERRREVLLAERAGRPVGFALLEISSPGLNLSELTSAFRVFVPGGESQVRQALIAAACARYGQLGRRPAALAEVDELPDFAAQGLGASKRYVSWTWHRSQSSILFDSVLAGLHKEQRRERERSVPDGERERIVAAGAEDRSARVVA